MLLEKLRIYLGHQKHLSHYLISESFLQENPIKQNSPELEWLRHPHALKKKKETFFLSAGPISDPAPDVGNVFYGLLGLNFSNFFLPSV